jgi:hypothetical protein
VNVRRCERKQKVLMLLVTLFIFLTDCSCDDSADAGTYELSDEKANS